jgi:G:T-mismatch repair DNA endonuclease (very short patch repair protein)
MKAAAARRAPESYVGGHPSPETLSAARRAYWSKLSPDARAKQLAAFIAAGQRHNRRSAQTKVENSMAKLLDALGVRYHRNVQIGRSNVDFLLEGKRIIECYGDFRHCNPRLYAPAWWNGSLRMCAEEKWERDDLRIQRLIVQGYVVHVFWEWEILNDHQHVMTRLRGIVGR